MYYNIDDIMKYIKNFHLYNGVFTDKNVDDFIYQIDMSVEEDNEYTYEMGATKLVIIPKETDYVIKIPFNGYFDYCWNEEEENWEEDNTDEFISFYSAGGEWNDNYCELEVDIYNSLPDEYKGLFLPIEQIGKFCDYPIYIQPKAKAIEGMLDRKKYCSKESLQTIKNNKQDLQTTLPEEWLASCLEYFNNSIFELKCFIDYLENNDLYADLHRGNIGYYNNKPVIIDYGGFND